MQVVLLQCKLFQISISTAEAPIKAFGLPCRNRGATPAFPEPIKTQIAGKNGIFLFSLPSLSFFGAFFLIVLGSHKHRNRATVNSLDKVRFWSLPQPNCVMTRTPPQ
jgi:hypothetical protein